jgi:hypothetical protein
LVLLKKEFLISVLIVGAGRDDGAGGSRKVTQVIDQAEALQSP